MNVTYILTGAVFAAVFLAIGRWFKRGNGWKWRGVSVTDEKFDRDKTLSLVGGLMYAVAAMAGGAMIAMGIVITALFAVATRLILNFDKLVEKAENKASGGVDDETIRKFIEERVRLAREQREREAARGGATDGVAHGVANGGADDPSADGAGDGGEAPANGVETPPAGEQDSAEKDD